LRTPFLKSLSKTLIPVLIEVSELLPHILRKIGIFPLESVFLFSNLKVTFINLKIQNRLNLGGYMGGK
jgi:hypothetical protein